MYGNSTTIKSCSLTSNGKDVVINGSDMRRNYTEKEKQKMHALAMTYSAIMMNKIYLVAQLEPYTTEAITSRI